MFGPPCPNCRSDNDWIPLKEGEECHCGWPATRNKAASFGDSELGIAIGVGLLVLAVCIGLSAVIAAVKYVLT